MAAHAPPGSALRRGGGGRGGGGGEGGGGGGGESWGGRRSCLVSCGCGCGSAGGDPLLFRLLSWSRQASCGSQWGGIDSGIATGISIVSGFAADAAAFAAAATAAGFARPRLHTLLHFRPLCFRLARAPVHCSRRRRSRFRFRGGGASISSVAGGCGNDGSIERLQERRRFYQTPSPPPPLPSRCSSSSVRPDRIRALAAAGASVSRAQAPRRRGLRVICLWRKGGSCLERRARAAGIDFDGALSAYPRLGGEAEETISRKDEILVATFFDTDI